jgi:hypothetical protein
MKYQLMQLAEDHGLWVSTHTAENKGSVDRFIVSTLGGKPKTDFGGRLKPRHLGRMFPGCSREAHRVLRDAWQVTLVDPQWNRNSVLWNVLEKLA